MVYILHILISVFIGYNTYCVTSHITEVSTIYQSFYYIKHPHFYTLNVTYSGKHTNGVCYLTGYSLVDTKCPVIM